MIRIIITLLCFIVFLASTRLVHADQYNLTPNSSFEDGIVTPAGWINVNNPSCISHNEVINPFTIWEDQVSRLGEKSISIKNIDYSISPGIVPIGWFTKDFILINNFIGTHRISMHFKGDYNNKNLRTNILICLYDSAGNSLGQAFIPSELILDESWGKTMTNVTSSETSISKIKIGIFVRCPTGNICSGSAWFDDITVRPIGNDFSIFKFEDDNRNGLKDAGEQPLEWRFQLYEHSNCIETNDRYPHRPGTGNQGYTTIHGISAGEFSVRELLKPGWEITTSICQNITIEPKIFNTLEALYFGNVLAPLFPYFSQKDPAWEGQEYDSANTFGPFFCGTTLAQCGCATTSSAMLLKYWGVDKSPSGDQTNPQSLDNWLKQNNGYAFGAVKWNSIAAYSVKANQAFGTQKIKFSGYGSANDFSTLDTELARDRPTILQEPGHFIVASQKQGSDYSIADPAWENKKTLAAYSNSFQSMRRFEKTNTDLSAIFIATPTPTELLITDSQGQKTGRDAAGNIYNQIPDSTYALEPAFLDQSSESPQTPPENLGVNTLVILAPDPQNYTLETFTQSPTYSIEFSGYDEDGDITVQNFEQTKADQFDINYSENGNNFEFFQTVEIDARHSAKSNPFNPSTRILPLSILASGDFDPHTIDINTIETGSNWNLLNASTILIGPRLQNEKSLLLLLENNGNYEEEICIRGKTLSGIPFRGCDTIRVVGNGL